MLVSSFHATFRVPFETASSVPRRDRSFDPVDMPASLEVSVAAGILMWVFGTVSVATSPVPGWTDGRVVFVPLTLAPIGCDAFTALTVPTVVIAATEGIGPFADFLLTNR